MKDFAEFERLLDSDECRRDRRAILDRIAEECEEADAYGTFVIGYANAVSRYELRKYHEWVNPQ